MLGDYLSEFATIVQQGAIAPAALELGFSQSALSRHLTALEAQLGCRLLERTPSGIRLTDDGRYVYDVALEVVALGEALKDRLAAREYQARACKVAVAGVNDVPCVAAALEQACGSLADQGVAVSLVCLPPASVRTPARDLWDGEADLVIVPDMPDGEPASAHDGLAAFELGQLPLSVFVEKDHPLACRGSVELSDIRGCTFGRAATRVDNLNIVWASFVRTCEGRGFTPACRTSSGGAVPGFDERHSGIVLACLAGSTYAERLKAQGFVELPLLDLTLPAVALLRNPDESTLRFARAVRTAWR